MDVNVHSDVYHRWNACSERHSLTCCSLAYREEVLLSLCKLMFIIWIDPRALGFVSFRWFSQLSDLSSNESHPTSTNLMSTSSLASSTATTTTNTFNDSVGLNGSSAALQCRVQYLDDTDPFASVNLPEPARPPSFTFLTSTILSNQLSSVQKVLNAPHKVSRRDCPERSRLNRKSALV